MQQLGIAAQNLACAKVRNQAFTGNFFKLIGAYKLKLFSLGSLYDAYGNRVSRNKLCTCAQAQQLVSFHAFGSIDLLQYEVTLGNGTGFIHNYSSNVFQSLHSNTALKENAVLGAGADAGEESQRHAQYQCAGAADNEEGQRSVNPFIPVAGNQGRNHSSQYCCNNNKRSIDTCEAGNEAVDGRLAGSSVLHAVQNAGYHGFFQNLFYTDFQHTGGIYAARNNLIAIFTLYRHRLAGYRRGIYQAFAVNNNAIQRNTVAYAYQQNVAYVCVSGRNNLHLFAYQQVDNLRTQVNSVHNLATALFYRTLLKIFAHAIEEHNANSLFPGLNSKRTQCCNGHEEVFVKYITLRNILQGSQHNASAQQNISKNQEVHMIRFRHQAQPFGDDEHSTAQYDFDNRLLFAQFGEDTAGFFAFLQLRRQRRLAFSLQQHNALFYLIGYSLHFLQQTVVILSTYAQFFRSKGQGSFINLRHSVQRTFNLSTAVSAVQILHQVYSALAA